jgi:hypothetical protein
VQVEDDGERVGYLLYQMVREGLSEEVISKQEPRGKSQAAKQRLSQVEGTASTKALRQM